ncbi:lytic murein transglycosylase [Actibacterium sp. 188UL27-1]|uniref:lytic murein transglycosylase n=1 Tax=Actibacterium sp. 188UL27-1 TaxID=2786961 RepID=UPI00351CADC7
MGVIALGTGIFGTVVYAAPMAVETSIRPLERPGGVVQAVTEIKISDAGFQRWIQAFRARAQAQGISEGVFQQAFRDVHYDAKIVELDRNQSEFTKTIWDYLDSAASDTRVANGKKALAQHRGVLDEIEQRYGVEAEIVTAIWGLESAYGAVRGNTKVIEALATLSYDGRRGAFFEAQLIDALKILQNGDTTPANMTGSWAGAMGHTQFMPTSYQTFAQDFRGDGKRDIWSDDPTDALASTAAYLAKSGWITGQPWGVEVVLPDGFDYGLTGHPTKKSPDAWAAMGIRDINGNAVPNHGPASILMPGGAKGAAFMIFKNFNVIERYNSADAYVIGVGHLSNRITGGPAIQSDWPREDRALKLAERKELQERLSKAGFDTQGIDGKIGPKTIAAIRAYQRSMGDIPDGYASLAVLKKLR